MKKLPKRLALATQTLRPLDPRELVKARGAGFTTYITTVYCISANWTECECKR